MYMKSKIIVGYAGIGKTYLGNTFSDVIDIDSSDYQEDEKKNKRVYNNIKKRIKELSK